MLLYETNSIQKLSNSTMIRDDKGKEAPALDLFAHVIRYLKNHMLSAFNTHGALVEDKDIHWVLPVPTISEISAKQFMREAAKKAGILTEQLTLCPDSVAAALYCQRIPSTKLIGSPVTRPFLSFSAGAKFMIIDLGLGGITIISIYQKQSDGTYKELHKPTLGPWVGTKVDEAFYQMIINIVGQSCFQKFKDDFKEDYLEFNRDLETLKRLIKPESDCYSKIRIKLPIPLVETMSQAIEQTRYASKMTCKRDILVMDVDLFKELFREPVNMLVEHLKELKTEDNLSGVSTLLMVGGFSESRMMQDAIMKAFPDKRVIVPEEAGLAVLKGAVMFGHEPYAVLESNPPGLL